MSLDLDAIEARARAATPSDRLSTNGYPLTDSCGLCVVCGAWTPARHPEAHDHKDGCQAEQDERALLGARAALYAHARQDIPALVAELRRLRASSLPARIDAPTGTVAEVVSVQVRYTLPTGGSWHESMSLATWRRQGNVREELRDSGGGGDREP